LVESDLNQWPVKLFGFTVYQLRGLTHKQPHLQAQANDPTQHDARHGNDAYHA
jgi:hypothetical protein